MWALESFYYYQEEDMNRELVMESDGECQVTLMK